jgi:tetratricopeptide (TPR) repeat protein
MISVKFPFLFLSFLLFFNSCVIGDKTHFEKAYELDQKGDRPAAIMEYTEELKVNPNNSKAFLERGKLKCIINKENSPEIFQDAIVDCQEAIKINPNYDEAYFVIGYTNFIMGKKKSALMDFKKAVQINPNNSSALFYIKNIEKELHIR